MNGNTSLVSIIIPFYNVESKFELFKMAINSLLNQSYKRIEVILVNDGSTDGSESLVYRLIEEFTKYGIKIVYKAHKENAGPGEARNTGIKIASGDYIAFLDSDDVFLPDYISKMLECFNNNPTIDIVFTAGYYYFKLLNFEKVYVYENIGRLNGLKKHELITFLIRNFPIPIGSATICKKKIFSVVTFDQFLSKRTCEDVDFAFQLLLKGYNPYFQSEPLVITTSYFKFSSRSYSSSIRCNELEVNEYLFNHSRLPLLESVRDKLSNKLVNEILTYFAFQEDILLVQSLIFERKFLKSILCVIQKPSLFIHWFRYVLLNIASTVSVFSIICDILIFIRIKSNDLHKKVITQYLRSLSSTPNLKQGF